MQQNRTENVVGARGKLSSKNTASVQHTIYTYHYYLTMVSFRKNAQSSLPAAVTQGRHSSSQCSKSVGGSDASNDDGYLIPTIILCLLLATTKTLLRSYIFCALLPTLSSAISVSSDWMISRSLISLFNTLPSLATASVCSCKACDVGNHKSG